jgi:hypothetical protein
MTRIRGLEDADPTAVPLPHGTEVTTRVQRAMGDRRVPQGAVGRVVGIVAGDAYDVQVVGVGVMRFRRDELVPRKGGQLRFAARREAAWCALSPCIVLESVVGSRAWGLASCGSDTDRRGAFVAPLPWTSGLVAAPEELVSTDGSATYWEVGKLVRQALRADPNTLETLFVAGARALDPMGERLLAERDAFPSAAIYGSFARYALSQLKKLRQSMRLAEHRAIVLDWLRATPPPDLDQVAHRLAVQARVEAPTPADAALLAKEYVKQTYHSLHDQGLIARADFAALATYAREGGAALDAPRELRPKNAYNLLRLLATALAWLRTGTPNFVVEEPLRSRLASIKRGEVPLTDVLDEAEALTPALDVARLKTPLPARPDVARADALLRDLRAEAARRFVMQAPGPWGAAAPAPSPPSWEDP